MINVNFLLERQSRPKPFGHFLVVSIGDVSLDYRRSTGPTRDRTSAPLPHKTFQ
ncbi:hypothetical protein [Mycobacterium sp. 236(2023)]|uniref:hypothetical protein n=1 Tax=Mycobacterium sp. 236(2023) TaxID=3038163 RepID=UPI002414ECF4|nr:hypothetical protein [Mycobacterium sp. 236(2023)]MDG4666309.1 hypothetical protein [Mycobacterium sp. 236(2023)]